MSNIILLKSRKTSFTTTPLNRVMIYGLVLEICLVVLITQCPGISDVFGGRPLDFWQYGWPAVPWSVGIMLWEESRKLLIRNSIWFEKHVFWWTSKIEIERTNEWMDLVWPFFDLFSFKQYLRLLNFWLSFVCRRNS